MEISNLNKERIKNYLQENKRPDGRKFLDYREIKIETKISENAEGSARVKIGQTEVIVGVKLDVQEPYPDHEDEGTMMVAMELSPIAGKRYENGPPGIDSIEIARIVDRGIRESGFIDWGKLCIKEGEKVWAVFIDIYAINDDGNLLDASAIGAIAALKTARFPVYDEENGAVKYGEFTKTPLPLTDKIPFTMTFHKVDNKFFIDPNREEEDTSEGRLTIAISMPKKDKMINAMQRGNFEPITIEELEETVKKAEEVYDNIFPKILKAVEKANK